MTLQSLEVEASVRPFSLRRLLCSPAASQYYRLAWLVVLANLAWFVYGAVNGLWWSETGFAIQAISNVMLANISLGILVRQQYVVNILFWLATRVPTSWPLSIRWAMGKVYHFGGLHSGGAGAGTVWFGFLVYAMVHDHIQGQGNVSSATLCLSIAIVVLLAIMVLTALARFRARHHDRFERIHRFGGWTVLVLFWLQTVFFIDDRRDGTDLADALLASPGFWMLVVLTASIALPWLRLKRVPVEIVRPSSHAAVVRFNYGDTPFPGSSNSISRNPLVEWHSFANIPTPGEDGYRLIISRAGDWTGSFINDCPSHVWVKGITTAGVARIEVLFKRVVYIATGSGIGPVLPHLLAKDVPIHLIWATRSPRTTYGDDLVEEILNAVPDATIWDTDVDGKPDLSRLAHGTCRAFGAEAVICISNQKLTRKVVRDMEIRGIPAFGAIWDS